MATVVISYSRVDQKQVRALVALLQRTLRGFEKAVFWDGDLEPGEPWFEQLKTHIDASNQLFVFWCFHSSISEQIRREFMYAFEQHKPVVPVLLDNTPLSVELAPIHGIDLRGAIRHRKVPPSGRAARASAVAAALLAVAVAWTAILPSQQGRIGPSALTEIPLTVTSTEGSPGGVALSKESETALDQYFAPLNPGDKVLVKLYAPRQLLDQGLEHSLKLYVRRLDRVSSASFQLVTSQDTTAPSEPLLSLVRTRSPEPSMSFRAALDERLGSPGPLTMLVGLPLVGALLTAIFHFRRWKREKLIVREFSPYLQ